MSVGAGVIFAALFRRLSGKVSHSVETITWYIRTHVTGIKLQQPTGYFFDPLKVTSLDGNVIITYV